MSSDQLICTSDEATILHQYGLYNEWKDSESDSCLSGQPTDGPLHDVTPSATQTQGSEPPQPETDQEKLNLDRLTGFLDERGNNL